MEDIVEKDMVLVEVDVEIVMEDNILVMEDNHLVVENNHFVVEENHLAMDDKFHLGYIEDKHMVLVKDMALFHFLVDHLYFLHF